MPNSEEWVPTFEAEAIENNYAPNGGISVELDDAVPGALFISATEDDTVGFLSYVRCVDARALANKIIELCDKEELS